MGGIDFFNLLAGEDINAGEGTLGGSVLSWLGGGDIDNLTWLLLQHNMMTFTDGTGGIWGTMGGTGISGFECVLVVRHGERGLHT